MPEESTQKEAILSYLVLQLESTLRLLSSEENSEQEEIRKKLSLSHDEIMDAGKSLIL